MKSILRVFVGASLACSVAAMAAPVENGWDNGNGGDVIRDLFEKARSAAASRVERLLSCSFPASATTDAKTWLMQNRQSFADDLRAAQHYWTVDAQATCAFTGRSRNEGIYLSYPTCHNGVTTLDQAVYTLVHETVHHFGVTDENFSDQVARAVTQATDRNSCPDTGSVWDNQWCSGPAMSKEKYLSFFARGAVSAANVMTLKYEGRVRDCVALTGCQDWVPAETVETQSGARGIVTIYTQNGYYYPIQPGEQHRLHFNILSGNYLSVSAGLLIASNLQASPNPAYILNGSSFTANTQPRVLIKDPKAGSTAYDDFFSTANLTDECFISRTQKKVQYDSGRGWTEFEYVLYGRF